MAFFDAILRESIQTLGDQKTTKTLALVTGAHGQMVDIAPAAIVAAQDCAHQEFVVEGQPTAPWITLEIAADG